MKKKVLTVILFCLCMVGIASAVEVINIDLKPQGDANAWNGTAGYDGGSAVWNAYSGVVGIGTAMGSQRSANLANSDEPCTPSTYAAQIWVTPGAAPSYYIDTNVANPSLLGDGFVKPAGAGGDPNIVFWGRGSYQGKFDIYVYGGKDAGSFTLHNKGVTTTKAITGSGYGGFIENANYVVFSAVDINDDPNYGFDSGDVRAGQYFISYTNKVSAIQLVSAKRPAALRDGLQIGARAWDVAYVTQGRGAPELFGVSTAGPDAGGGSPYGYITYLDGGEYALYDITTDDANKGEYEIRAWVDVTTYDANYLDLSVNNILAGTVSKPFQATGWIYPTNWVSVNIWAGTDTFKWYQSQAFYYNIGYFEFKRLGDINMPDCNAAYKYGYGYAGDLNHDCHVDYKDLRLMATQWLTCYSPDPNDCP